MGKRRDAPPGRRPVPPRFRLRREVLVGYAAPALSAGAGGLISGQPGLTLAAWTSIAGTSALSTALTGGWLSRRAPGRRWARTVPRPLLAAGSALVAGAVAALAAQLATGPFDVWTTAHLAPWAGRLQLDLPIAAAPAAAIVSWRWRSAERTRTVPGPTALPLSPTGEIPTREDHR
ncbi:hypothetical protein AB0D08_20610 [Kitasatospora sp. NPDC048540]|uniref:hypothetical protein n=1 Tax=unclassified Kitasatospora TaxID=2633591 RepID=UPI00068E0CBE|nr:hypothetical protein [Kitasatospora sp. MBT63]